MFILLTILVGILLYQIFVFKKYKSSVLIFYWFIINAFFTPSIYYVILKGTSYKSFSESDLIQYMLLGSIFLFFIIFFNIVIEYKYPFKKNKNIISISVTHKIRYLSALFGSCVLIISVGYFFIYRSGYPIVQIFQGKYLGSLYRPDMSGALPHYETFSTFQIAVIPLLMFYFREKNNWGKKKTLLGIAGAAFLSIAGGNKAVIVYLVIFIWIYIWGLKINWKIALSVILLFETYILIMSGEMEYNYGILNTLQAPFRRFFVTQGAMLINRIALINQGFAFDYKTINTDVYIFIYKSIGGTAPSFYVGDLFIYFGYTFGMVLSVIVAWFILLIGKIIDIHENKMIYRKWPFYFMIYLLGNSGFNLGFIVRMTILLFSIMILDLSGEAHSVFKSRKYSVRKI